MREDGFRVRKDMLNNAVGYQEASIGDAWTGMSRLDEKHHKAFADTATALMGKNALPWLTRAESFWQAGISVAKNTIVIRSVIVPVSNLASNFFQLMTVGVGARDISKGLTTKLVEIDAPGSGRREGVARPEVNPGGAMLRPSPGCSRS